MLIPNNFLLTEYSGSANVANYRDVGKTFANKFASFLKPNTKVLEIGCGCARIAQALPDDIIYEGFDIFEDAIEFCNTINRPNYTFKWVNLYNTHFNKGGKIEAQDFIFPYENNTFDFIFLTSVFTHVMPEVVEHYLSEIQRVLKPGGDCVFTCYLLKDGNRDYPKWEWHKLGNCFVVYPMIPDAIVGYEEEFFTNLIKIDKIERQDQDVIYFSKKKIY